MAQTQMQKTKTACTKSNMSVLQIVKANIDHWNQFGDWEPLAYVTVHHRDAGLAKRVCKAILSDDIGYETDRKSKWGAVFTKPKGNDLIGNAEAYAALETMVMKGLGVNARIKTTVDGKEKTVLATSHYFPSVSAKPSTFTARELDKCVEAAKRVEKDELAERVKDAERYLSALKARLNGQTINH